MDSIGVASVMGIILSFVIGLILNFLPTIIAFLRGNLNKMQVLLINIALWVIGIVIELLITFLLGTSTFAMIVSVVIGIAQLAAWVFNLVKAIKDF